MRLDDDCLVLTCTSCGFRRVPHRGWPRSLWEHVAAAAVDRLPATWPVECSSCPEEDGEEPVREHFVEWPDPERSVTRKVRRIVHDDGRVDVIRPAHHFARASRPTGEEEES